MRFLRLTLSVLVSGAVFLTTAACNMSPRARISGTVTYLPRIALPPNAQVSVQLVDVSLADAPAMLIGEDAFTTSAQVPLPFEIQYDRSVIQDNHTYALQAEIRDELGSLLFINTTAFLVLTGGNPTDNVEIILEQVTR